MITSIELCAGAGGLALGLEQAGLDVTELVEIDKDCVATLKTNRPNWNIVHLDIAKISLLNRKVDVLTGGIPCQPFSFAGKGLGFKDNRGNIFFEFLRLLKELQPKLFLIENVKGLAHHNKGKTLQEMFYLLEAEGYNVQCKILNAVNYEVPQVRERLVIVGTVKSIEYSFPKTINRVVSVKEALIEVPLSEGITYSKEKAKIMSMIPEGGNWKSLPINIQKEYMKDSFNSGGGKTGIARRLSWNKPSLTLLTSPAQKQTDRCHPSETRPLTIREYARIQTFPDIWKFEGSVSSQYKQIGNAVPVKLGYYLGISIIEAFNK